MSTTYLILKLYDYYTSAEHTHTEAIVQHFVSYDFRDNSIFRRPPNQSYPMLTQIQSIEKYYMGHSVFLQF